ncbi:MAG TPA: hypothetical protein VFP56_00490 [Candidatus Limnocylindrales bacterium]|nr:hypothetical protein [Candidatus Limnocylindrales bacterium]
MTEELAASIPDEAALDALAAAIGPARHLGLDVSEAERVLAERDGAHGPAGATATGRAARAALTKLANAAGLRSGGVRDLIPDPAQRRGIDGAIAEVALILDMDGFESQALALVRARARAKGLGPIRWIAALRDRRPARPPEPAQPASHLAAWKSRGVLTRAADQVRRAIDEALPEVPEGLRPVYSAAGEGDLEARIERSLERLIDAAAPQAESPPDYPYWALIGRVQWLNLALFAFAIVSLVGGILGFMPVWRIHLPFFRDVPGAPFVLILSPLIAFALTLGLKIHAERLGRSWSSRIENEVRRGVRVVLEAEAFAPLAPIESARAHLGEAWHRVL